jgi:hypothetical protein
MRAGVVAVLIGAALAFAPAASAKDAGFLDLPGFGSVERLTDAKAPAVSGTTTSQHVTATDRVPAPDAAKAADVKASTASVTPVDTAMIRSLPGGNHIPVLGIDAAASRRGNDGVLVAFALVIVVLFTRFLFRLNTLGRTA